MKFITRVFILAVVLGLYLPVSAQKRPTAARKQASAPGGDYVRLLNWAEAHNFDLRWVRRDKVLELSNHWGNRLLFTSQSREVKVNGTEVMLSFPMEARDGVGWISELDVNTAIQPILYPAKNKPSDKIKTIVLDPGHGGKDTGMRNRSYEEKKYTLLLAQELQDQLIRAGFNVSLTRTTDVYLNLPPRPDMANRRNADLFLSLHFNAVEFGKNQVSGSQVYCFTPVGASSTYAGGKGTEHSASAGNHNDSQNIQLAYQIQKSLIRTLGTEDRGVCHARYAVLRDARMPAVLIEAGYLSHPAEGKKIIDLAYRRQMAQAIVNGVQAYKTLVEQ